MALYTFFLEYRGGTYISQVRAASPSSALKSWARKLGNIDVWGLGPKSKSEMIEKLQLDAPTAIEGIQSTWCCTAFLRNHLAVIHFIQTET